MRKTFMKYIKELEETVRCNEKNLEKMKDLFGYSFESPIQELYLIQLEFSIELIAKICDIEEEGLKWFVWDNDFGKNELECEIDGKLVEIKNANDFWQMEK